MSPYNNDPVSDAEADEIVRREAAKHGLTETKYRMMKAANTDVVQSIVWDHVGKNDVTRPTSIAATPSAAAPVRGTGWVEPRPFTKQPGIDLIDQMVENDTMKQRLQARDERVRAALTEMEYQERIKKQHKLNQQLDLEQKE
jgi:hypothetical protein